MGPFVRGQSAYWVQYNSGKKSLGLDMRNAKGKEIICELVKVSDILSQHFRPGTIATMGFGYDNLKALNPLKRLMAGCSWPPPAIACVYSH